jgi:hypothetical protein
VSITAGASGRSVSYTYDSLGRLSTALTTGSSQFPQWGLSDAYDQYGNRLSQTVAAGSGPPSSLAFPNPGGAQTNQPSGWCFDASGNLLSKTASQCPPPAPTFVYDGEDRLVNAPNAGVTYVYDGNGTRVGDKHPAPRYAASQCAAIYSCSRSTEIKRTSGLPPSSIDTYNPRSGVGGTLGHVFHDVLWGQIKQKILHGDLDKRCAAQ